MQIWPASVHAGSPVRGTVWRRNEGSNDDPCTQPSRAHVRRAPPTEHCCPDAIIPPPFLPLVALVILRTAATRPLQPGLTISVFESQLWGTTILLPRGKAITGVPNTHRDLSRGFYLPGHLLSTPFPFPQAQRPHPSAKNSRRELFAFESFASPKNLDRQTHSSRITGVGSRKKKEKMPGKGHIMSATILMRIKSMSGESCYFKDDTGRFSS